MPDPGARAGAEPRLYLKRHREQVLAWSQVKAAEVIGVHPSTLWRWEAGLIATIRPYDLQLIACAYGLDYADLASAEQRRAPPKPAPAPVPVLGWGVSDTVAAFRMLEEGPVDHQLAGLRAGDDLTGLAREWLTADPVEAPFYRGALRVDLALVEQLEGMVLRLRHLDDQIGGADLLPAARQRHRRVTDLLGGTYPSDVGRRLHAVAADLGQLLGWLAFDTGQHGLAQRQWIAALHVAHSAADAEIGANILAGMAMQCYVLGNPRDALSLVETAESAVDAHGSARVRSMLACRHAVAAAKAGDETASQHALSRAQGLLEADDHGGPSWLYYYGQADEQLHAGTAWLAMNRPERAERSFRAALETMDPGHVRDRGVILARVALTRIAQGEIEGAAQVATESLILTASQLHSMRVADELADVAQALAAYRSTVSTVSDFHNHYASLVAAE